MIMRFVWNSVAQLTSVLRCMGLSCDLMNGQKNGNLSSPWGKADLGALREGFLDGTSGKESTC